MEFSIGLDYLLILLLQVAVHYLSSHAIYILSALYDLIFATKCLNMWKTHSFLGLS